MVRYLNDSNDLDLGYFFGQSESWMVSAALEARCKWSLGLALLLLKEVLLVQVHAIVTINTVNVIDALLVLAPALDLVLHRHIAHPVPPLLYVLATVTLLHQALNEVPFVGRLPTPQPLEILLMLQHPIHVVLFP